MARPALLLPALFGLGFGAGVALADPLQESEALAMLQKIADAARQLNYAGTFVYQHGDQVETSRIVHFADASGEYEKLETLDGPRREIIRNNDEVMCYYLDAKIMRSEKRVARRSFPALLPEQLSALTEYYQIRKGEPERIAGFDSQALVLEPRDGMRYGHKFWAEANSGLLLKARMVNERHNVVEQFSFTQLAIGSGDQPRHGQTLVQRALPRMAGGSFRAQPDQQRRIGLGRKEFPRRFPQDHGDAPQQARQLDSGYAHGVFGRTGGGVGVHRADGKPEQDQRGPVASGRHQHLHQNHQ